MSGLVTATSGLYAVRVRPGERANNI